MTSKEINKYVGIKVHQLREKLGVPQESIATILDVSRMSVVNIESGRHGLTLRNLLLLCSIFKCSPNDILPPAVKIKFSVEEKTVVIKRKKKFIKIIK